MLHVLRPKRVATGVERRSGSHRVVKRKAVSFGDPRVTVTVHLSHAADQARPCDLATYYI